MFFENDLAFYFLERLIQLFQPPTVSQNFYWAPLPELIPRLFSCTTGGDISVLADRENAVRTTLVCTASARDVP